jgi:ribosomal protein L31
MVRKDSEGNEIKTVLNRTYEGEEIIRKGGMNYAGPWIVNASVASLQNMQIEVKHECHPLWDVTSNFYRDGGVMR